MYIGNDIIWSAWLLNEILNAYKLVFVILSVTIAEDIFSLQMEGGDHDETIDCSKQAVIHAEDDKSEDFVSVKESECIPEDPREPEFVPKHDWVNVLGHDRLRLKVFYSL